MSVAAERTRTQLGVLNQLLAVASVTGTVARILDQSLGIVLDGLGEKVGGAYLVEGDRLQLVAHRGLGEQLDGLQSLGLDSGLWQACAKGVEIVSPSGQGIADGLFGRALSDMGCRWILALPLLAHTEMLGCLLIGSGAEATFKQADREFLDTAGRAVGLAVESSRSLAQMERRLRESRTLYEISRTIAATRDLDELLNLIVRLAVDTIDRAGNCVLHLLNEETGDLHPRALSFIGQVRPDAVGRSRMRIGHGVAGYALETGQVVNVPDVSQDSRFVRAGAVRSFASMLVAPLILGDRRIGTLSVDSQVTHAFSPDTERLLMTLATQAAAAIENARLVRDLQGSLRDLRSMQAQLIQSEKLSAIGQLIAGVAHELNNPLTAVIGYTQLLQTTPGLDEGMQSDLSKVYVQAQRAAKIVQNLLTFARQHKAERQLVDVNEIVERTLELRAYQFRVENIEVMPQLEEGIPCTMADPNQLQQVFLNLINNARDAMAEHRGRGNLIVKSETCGDKIRVSFIDDGPGLSAKVKQHLFEPFFTTKEVGKGTGLGLSICFGIIGQHEGRIWAESEEGQGATFLVELPVVEEEAADQEPDEREALVSVGKGKLVLVVDDEHEVTSVLQRVLSVDGHHVVLARNGRIALDRLAQARARGTHFDLIVSDIKMPGLSGPALYSHICREHPEMGDRILFITGDTMNPSTLSFLDRVQAPHLDKPFTIDELRRAMIQMLGT